MNRTVGVVFLVGMILVGVQVGLFASGKDVATYTGYISDKSCGRNVDAACNKMCFDRGLPPVLVVDGTGEILEFEKPELFKPHPGAHVQVRGRVAGGVLHTAGFKVLSEPAPAPMAHDAGATDDAAVRFPKDQASVRLPFELLANVPYIQVKVNGMGPFTFAVDTGSHLVFAQELAAEMGLDPNSRAREAVELTLGDGLTVPVHASFASFENLWALPGRRFYGDIGYSVLKHFVAEFDYEHQVLTLYDPHQYRHQGPAAALPTVLAADYDPQFQGTFTVGGGASSAKFTLDTGAGGTTISVPLVKKYGLLERVTQKVASPPSKSLPDGVNAVVFDAITARIDSVTLGQFTVKQPLIALSRDTGTIFATDLLGVNLGGNILRRFTLTIDYPGRRVFLAPNGHFRDPFLADASGLVLTAQGRDFKRIVVHGVVPGSPAGKAGLKEGDIITAIDGESTDKYALWQIQDLFKESGKEKRLTIRRGGATLAVTIQLRALA